MFLSTLKKNNYKYIRKQKIKQCNNYILAMIQEQLNNVIHPIK